MENTKDITDEKINNVVKLFEDSLDKQEELAPELKDRVYQSRMFPVLHHPLVVIAPYHERLAGQANEMLRQKKRLLEKLSRKNDFNAILFLYERPYRTQFLFELRNMMSNEEYWSLLAWVWTDSENIVERIDEWEIMLNDKRDGKRLMMDEEEQKVFDELPDSFPVYRGVNLSKEQYQQSLTKRGFSWTLSKDIAEWFSRRWSSRNEPNGCLIKATVNKEDVHAYLSRAAEKEVIITKDIEWRFL